MVTEAQFQAATKRTQELREKHSHALKAHYDQGRNRIVIELANGVEIAFDPHRTQDLEMAAPADLAEIEISASGLGLYFPRCDADFSIPALMQGIFGTRKWMAAQMGAKGGKVVSQKKTKAAQSNGKLGGRPKKVPA